MAVVERADAPLIIIGRRDGDLRSLKLGGTAGPVQQPDAHHREITALAVVERPGAPLIITGGWDGHLRGWHLDGTPGPLQGRTDPLGMSIGSRRDAITALAVVEHNGVWEIITVSEHGDLRSWHLDGTYRPLHALSSHSGKIIGGSSWSPTSTVTLVEDAGAPLIITGAQDGDLCSWRLNGTPGPLRVPDAHPGGIIALAVVEDAGAPLIVSGGQDGALRSWRVGPALVALERSTAREVEVREVLLGSLDIVLQLPVDVLATAGVAGLSVIKVDKILDAIKRVAGFPAEVRLHRTQLEAEAEQVRAHAEARKEEDRLAEARALSPTPKGAAEEKLIARRQP